MKQLSINIFFLLFFFTVTAQEKVYLDKDWNETTIENAEFYRTIEKKGNLYAIKDYFISGKLQFEGFSKNKTEPLENEGTCIWYHTNGRIAQKIDFKDNKVHGDLMLGYSNGNVKAKGFYKDGNAEGIYTEYFPSGDISYETNFVNGKMDGAYNKYNFKGKLEQRLHYKNGVKHGAYEIYTDGELAYKGSAKDGFQDGLCQEFNTFSGLVDKEYTVKDRKLHGRYAEYDNEGSKIIEGTFKDGIVQTYDLTIIGKREKSYELNIKLNLNNGVENWKISTNDSLLVDSYYEKGRKTNVWKLYNIKANKLVLTADYSNAICNDGYVQKVPNFGKSITLSPRFRSIYNFTKKPCDAVEFKLIAEDDLAKAIIDQYKAFQDSNIESTKMSESTENETEEVEVMVVASDDGSDDPICNTYEDYETVTLCTQQNKNINYNVFIGLNPKSLKIISEQTKPSKNQILIFFKGNENYRNNYKREVSFSIPDALKKTITNGEIDKEEIIRFLRKGLLDVHAVSNEVLYNALEKELNK